MSDTAYGFGVCAFGCKIAVLADCEATCATLDRYILPWLPHNAPDPGRADAVFRVVNCQGRFRLLAGDSVVSLAPHAAALVRSLGRVLDEEVVRRLTTLAAVHAGVVACGGFAVLLPAGSGSGKSSLVAELVRRGAVYFSDEYALIDSEGRAHPYPRPLMVRNGREQFPVLPAEWNAAVGGDPLQVGWILSLRYDPAAGWQVSRVEQSEGLLTLLCNTPHVLADSGRILAAFQRVSAGAACYAGVRGDAGDAAGHILRLTSGRP